MTLERHNRLLIGLGIAAAILIGRLFVIQIVDTSYKIDASNNSMVYQTIYPTRGIIHDRNGKILVGNKMTYDLLVTPKEVEAFDTLTLCNVLGISPEFVREKMDEYHRYRTRNRPLQISTSIMYSTVFMSFICLSSISLGSRRSPPPRWTSARRRS